MAAPKRTMQPKAPELGSFPLDHFRECKPEIDAYYKCLEAHDQLAPSCREPVKAYIQCRMNKGLMTAAPIETFNIPDTEFVVSKHRHESRVRDALRSGAVAASSPTLWESRYKREDLNEDDGYERPKSEDPKKK